ncbi:MULTISPECIES: STAS domain-containing protein [unclassified Ancylobacter]|jgi:anti-anti-sigma factor|uniref:STAS domain-containing protein n=1 Tax=unclassified Ancylobacter TaxID=2626613 RepID=UPI00226FD351|nr:MULTISPECIES: STAS domain-containing protein [unclassified Ancylobacter]WAC26057.1 STAS domain-containing protein [Ancylobacter sp. SL191]WGD31517.1 STAS domain-containing protein [Ancylobacter sp. WKF20]
MQIDRFIEKDVVITTVKGRLDSSSSHKLDDFLAEIPQGNNPILLDFAELTYISSAGLRVVLKATKLARSQGVALAICSLVPQVHEVFDVSGFTTLIPIHPSRDAALAALA